MCVCVCVYVRKTTYVYIVLPLILIVLFRISKSPAFSDTIVFLWQRNQGQTSLSSRLQLN